MTLLRSLMILLVLALTPAHVAAEAPQIMAGPHVMAQISDLAGDCCDSGTHQLTCQMQMPPPEGIAMPAARPPARQIHDRIAQDRRQGRSPGLALRPPIPG